MKRSALIVAVSAVLVAAPAAAQWTGMSVLLPTPGVSIEPYFSPGIRYIKTEDAITGVSASQTKFGYALGANLTFGMLGVHLAYDYQKLDVGSTGVFGVGAHLDIRAPGGF